MNNLPRVVVRSHALAVDRTCDLLIASPTRYRCATTPPTLVARAPASHRHSCTLVDRRPMLSREKNCLFYKTRFYVPLILRRFHLFSTFMWASRKRETVEGETEVQDWKSRNWTTRHQTKKGSPYSIAERRVSELIPVLGSQPAGDVSHKPGGRLPLLSARPTVTIASLKRAATSFASW